MNPKKDERERKAWAILHLNLKGKKKKVHDWITIAEATQYLVDKYNSKTVSDRIKVSNEIIRSILTLLTLPNKVKQLIKKRKILLDVGEALSTIDKTENQIKIAQVVADLPSHQARDIIQYFKGHPETSIDKFKKEVMKSKKRTKELFLTVIPLDKQTFSIIKSNANKKKIGIEQMIIEIVKEWTDREEK